MNIKDDPLSMALTTVHLGESTDGFKILPYNYLGSSHSLHLGILNVILIYDVILIVVSFCHACNSTHLEVFLTYATVLGWRMTALCGTS